MSNEIKNEPVDEKETKVDETAETSNKTEKTSAVDKGDEKTFTQSELVEILAKRLSREKEKQSDMEAKLQRLKELEEAEEERKKAAMTEQERLQAEKEAAEKRAEEAEEKAQTASEAANQRIIDTELRSVARALDANDVNDVLALVDKSLVTIADDGTINGAEDLIEAMKTDKPWLFKRSIGADALGGSNPSKNPSVDELTAKEKELAELKQAATKDRRLLGKVTALANEIRQLRNRK